MDLESSLSVNDQIEISIVSEKVTEEYDANIERLNGGENNDKAKEPVSAKEITEEAICDPEDVDVEASVHPESPVEGAKDSKKTQRTP